MQPDPSRVNDDSREASSLSAGENIPAAAPPDHGDMVAHAGGKRSLFGWLWPPVLLLVLATVAVFLWLNHDMLLDRLWLRGYTPPADIKQLAVDASLTPYAERLLYVNRPIIEPKAPFNHDCPNASKEVAVLGCYRGDRQGIYIYQITDKRLTGIQQVTAAHEMLHQAYDRLSASERRSVDSELQAYAKTVTDTVLLDKIDAYRKLEPHELTNEMHSIFGTEVSSLPPALETYYKKYFNNRKDVLALHEQYQSAFTQRQAQIEAYDAQLAQLNSQITTARADLKARETALQTQRAEMEGWLRSGQVARYNAAVPSYNAAVETYKQKVAATNATIAQYNDIIDKRNAITVEEQELLKAQNSNAASSADKQ